MPPSVSTAVREWSDPAPCTPSAFEADVLAGLTAPAKTLPSKYLYDAEGSRLFEAICDLPEYYPTRAEIALLRDLAGELAASIPRGAALVEFGSGASLKTRILLDAAPHIGAYVPIDISREALASAAEAIRADYPGLPVLPQTGDFTQLLNLPAAVARRPCVGFFPGSTIGNFLPGQDVAFLANARQLLGRDARFILGADIVKPEAVLVPAYDDAAGVTAAFNVNLLARMNRELGANADLAGFRHRAVWRADLRRIEMHLVSVRRQSIRIGATTIEFDEGEHIHTENSRKFTDGDLDAIADRAGWRTLRRWVSPAPAFSVTLLDDPG